MENSRFIQLKELVVAVTTVLPENEVHQENQDLQEQMDNLDATDWMENLLLNLLNLRSTGASIVLKLLLEFLDCLESKERTVHRVVTEHLD